jgi:hypothetical protein
LQRTGDNRDRRVQTAIGRPVVALRLQDHRLERADPLYIVGDNFTFSHAKQIVELAEKAPLAGGGRLL